MTPIPPPIFTLTTGPVDAYPEVLRALWSDIAPTRKAVEEEQLKWQP